MTKGMCGQLSGFDSDILNEVKDAVAAGRIEVVQDGNAEKLLTTRYRWATGRIDWQHAERFVALHGVSFAGGDRSAIQAFLQFCAAWAGISSRDPVQYSGDNTEACLRMSFAEFLSCAAVLFGYPQHCYVYPRNADWCIQYTFEDDVYFGFAPT